MTVVPIKSQNLNAVEISWFSALCSDKKSIFCYHLSSDHQDGLVRATELDYILENFGG